ncbi:Flavin-containing monooxygenase [Melia azedarach]|uniref:Flavin-containing monooxygenase n=1 Tax=Melia azedarach TaxID=155640 RepID=A0ACC1WP19_MELAZ|nr:Flavin-containing monooxygenase [Melia azedarach]
MEEVLVVIVGAGPAGLATSACLNRLSIPNIVLEREDCSASLWKKRAYDRLKLHLAKYFCKLPYMPFPCDTPTFISRTDFINYLDNYESHFGINPRYHRSVELASYDENSKTWLIKAKNTTSNVEEVYIAHYLVVTSGENSEGLIPKVHGLDGFEGEYFHSNKYKNGRKYFGKDVLVVGCGNSGMEIAYDLSNWGAYTSIVVRSSVHVLTKEIVFLGMLLLKFLPCKLVDFITVMLSKMKFGNGLNYSLKRPKSGPFYHKAITGRSPTIDVGAMDKIRAGEIQVFPSIMSINGKEVNFENGEMKHFDVIIFATGYKSTVRNWLKDGKDLFNDYGMPKESYPNQWKGENGIYCAGFSRKGLYGISIDAKNIANDISSALSLN